MSRCRSCDAPILWALTATGKRMPIDFWPVAEGNIALERNQDGERIARVLAPGERTEPVEPEEPADSESPPPRYTSHFATCPRAGEHRRPAR